MQNIDFKCITKEADLMSELLKHGAGPTDDIIQQSSVICMCALSLVHLQGFHIFDAAAAMLVSVCLHHTAFAITRLGLTSIPRLYYDLLALTIQGHHKRV